MASSPKQEDPSSRICISQQWLEAAETIAYGYVASHPTIALICRLKNSGKSTFSRHLINVLLKRKVGYLDNDVRQPEFTVAGLLSFTVVDTQTSDIKDTEYFHNLPLYKVIYNGDWEATMKFLINYEDALTASPSADGDIALHVAFLIRHVEIVANLVNRLEVEVLTTINRNSSTALNYVTIEGIVRIAEVLVKKNKGLLCIPNQNGLIPVIVASLYDQKDMLRYLYVESPKKEISPERGKNGAMLLTTCIIDEQYSITQ